MFFNIYKLILSFFIFSLLLINLSFGDVVKKIEITGNERIPAETIIMFMNVSIEDDLDNDSLNNVLKNIYNSKFFKNVNIRPFRRNPT